MTRVLPLLLMLVACSASEETPAPPAHPAAHPDITLPVVEDGDPFPEGALVIRVPKYGFLPVVRMPDRREIPVEGWDHLTRVLRTEADLQREGSPGRPSTLDVVLWADADSAWLRIARTLIACARPDIHIYRVHVAVGIEAGPVRTLPWFLPRRQERYPDLPRERWLRIRAGDGEGGLTLDRALASRSEYVGLIAESRVPFRSVVAVLAAARRRGLRVLPVGPPPEGPEGIEAGPGFCFDWYEPERYVPPPSRPVTRAIEWLARAQDDGGSWQDADTTGLVLLAFLGAGETHRIGPHVAEVKRGLQFLKRTVPEDRRHPFRATLAMMEAYRLTGSPLFKQAAQASVDRTFATVHHVDQLLIASARDAKLRTPEGAPMSRRTWQTTDPPLWMYEDLEAWFRTAVAARRADTEESRAWLAELRALLVTRQRAEGQVEGRRGAVRSTALAALCLEICDGGKFVVGCRP